MSTNQESKKYVLSGIKKDWIVNDTEKGINKTINIQPL